MNSSKCDASTKSLIRKSVFEDRYDIWLHGDKAEQFFKFSPTIGTYTDL